MEGALNRVKLQFCLPKWLGDALKDLFFPPPENSNFIFSPIFRKNWPKPPGESKTRCPESGFSIWAQSERIWPISSNFFIPSQNFKKKWPKNESIFNCSPTPQPPSPSPQTPKDAPDHAGVVGQSFIPIGPNGASFMPIFRFKFRHFFNHPPQNTFGHSGIHRAEERKSSFFYLLLVSFEDSTIDHFPFLRPVI